MVGIKIRLPCRYGGPQSILRGHYEPDDARIVKTLAFEFPVRAREVVPHGASQAHGTVSDIVKHIEHFVALFLDEFPRAEHAWPSQVRHGPSLSTGHLLAIRTMMRHVPKNAARVAQAITPDDLSASAECGRAPWPHDPRCIGV